MIGLISWDALFIYLFLVLDFRSNFFNNFLKNYYYDEQLLVSKKVTSVVGPNVKWWSNVILVLPSMTIKLSIVRKKKKGTIECDKSTIRSNVGTPQCNNGNVKFENKK